MIRRCWLWTSRFRTCQQPLNPVCNLTIKKLQVDEIWSFIGMKQKNVPADDENSNALQRAQATGSASGLAEPQVNPETVECVQAFMARVAKINVLR